MREAAQRIADYGVDALASEALGRLRADRLRQLSADGSAPPFFGRTDRDPDEQHPAGEVFHIGRRHIRDSSGDPMVIDWRAPIARPFYRASTADRQGVRLRRRFGFADGRLTSFEDEHLDAGEELGLASHLLRDEIERPRVGPDARHRGHHPARPGRAGAGRPGHLAVHPGRARHRQDRGRPAPGGLPALQLPRAAAPVRGAGGRPELGVPALHRRRAAVPGRERHPAEHRRPAGLQRAARPDRPGAGRDPQGRCPDGRAAAPGGVQPRRQAHRGRGADRGHPPVPDPGRAGAPLRRRRAPEHGRR